MQLFGFALVVFALLGIVFGWLSWFRVRELERRLRGLQGELQLLRARLSLGEGLGAAGRELPSGAEESDIPGPVPESKRAIPADLTSPPLARDPTALPASHQGVTTGTSSSDPEGAREAARAAWSKAAAASGSGISAESADNAAAGAEVNGAAPSPGGANGGSLQQHWMTLLGGACVGLAGVFLVRYSIDQGLLGPGARIVAGLLLGLALHAAAEFLRRRQGPHPALAGLAAGGSLTLFAALLAALHLYQLVSPTLAFLALAAVAMGTLLLALRHGPLLAALGLLGAYAVPLLVGDGPGGDWIVLLYALLVSAAALLLLSQVRRHWLWWGVLAGGLFWWLLTLGSLEVVGLQGIYLAALGYLLLALPWFDFSLRRRSELPLSSAWRRSAEPGLEARLPWALVLLTLAQTLGLANRQFTDDLLVMALSATVPLILLVLRAAAQHRNLMPLAWLLMLAQSTGLLLARLDGSAGWVLRPWPAELLPGFYWFCLLSAALYSVLALTAYRRARQASALLSLAILAPPLHLALAWLLSGPAAASLQWTLLALLLGACGLALAGWRLSRGADAREPAWLLIGGHAAYSLAAAFQLREAGLTFALALQIVSLAWAIRRFDLPVLRPVLKGVVSLVLLRLSLNPWLFDYPAQGHWTLWAYGGATLCAVLASLLLAAQPRLRAWTQGAALHLFTLFVWVELRWLLYDGDVFAARFDFLEACLGMNLAGALSLVYYWRARLSSHLAWLYGAYAWLLLGLALLAYALILRAVLGSAAWALEAFGTRPLFNLLLAAFASPVLFALLARYIGAPAWRVPASWFSAFAGFVFVSLEIRHLWTGTVDLRLPYSNGELYSYSAVWLALALLAVLGGAWRWGNGVYRAGMALLALVLAKLFLIDLAGLDGLLRVASFLGMGLSLLAIAYLHQRLARNT